MTTSIRAKLKKTNKSELTSIYNIKEQVYIRAKLYIDVKNVVQWAFEIDVLTVLYLIILYLHYSSSSMN